MECKLQIYIFQVKKMRDDTANKAEHNLTF